MKTRQRTGNEVDDIAEVSVVDIVLFSMASE